LINTAGDVVLVDGNPTPTHGSGSGSGQPQPTPGTGSPLLRSFGFGDTVIKARAFLVDDGGSESPVPSISPFFKVKIPTGDASKDLTTGQADYGFGVELDKQIKSTLLFGDLGYTFIGKIAGLDLRNRPMASFGLGQKASQRLTVSGLIDWQRALVADTPDPVEVVGVISYKATPTTTVSPNFFVGLTNGTSAFGVGVEFAFKFGRY
jgi:hypothetical protein